MFRDTKATGVYVSASGAVYVVGMGVLNKGGAYRLVRKSTNGGATWSTVDQVTYPRGNGPTAVAADAAGNVYVAGKMYDDADVGHWVVRRGAAGGTSWTTIDDLRAASAQGGNTVPRSVAVDNASGSVYVTGFAPDASIFRRLSSEMLRAVRQRVGEAALASATVVLEQDELAPEPGWLLAAA